MLFIAWFACHKTDPADAAPVAPVNLPPPTVPAVPAAPSTAVPAAAPVDAAAKDAMLRALSARDAVSCADVEGMTASPVPVLVELVDVEMPPTVGMRAAGCLVDGHAAEVADRLETWLKTDGNKGLALLVAQKIDVVPADVAGRLTTAAMAGPYAAELKPVLAKSARPEVRSALEK